MLPDETGMNTAKVDQTIKKLESASEIESKIEGYLKDIEEKAASAYHSENAMKLNKNNTLIEEAEHSKNRNLKSYRLYIEKYKEKYTNLGTSSVEKSSNIL